MRILLIAMGSIQMILNIIDTGYCQVRDCSGEYIYRSGFYFESIILKRNGQFSYTSGDEFTKANVTGNWQLRDGTIILDSYPQRDRIIVYESFQKKTKSPLVFVCNKQKEPISYSLYYTTASNDTIALRYQWLFSKLEHIAKAFYIVDAGGTTSPIYTIEGTRSNVFHVLFETHRVFENEAWNVDGNEIAPRGKSGKLQKYRLLKVSDK